MNERREPTISPLQLGPEDSAAKKPEASSVQAKSAQPSARRGTSNSRPPSSGGSMLPVISLVIGLFACGGLALLFLQIMKAQQSLERSSTLLSKAEARIATLEEKLELTGDESVQSMTVLQSKIKTNTSEIRKLWGVAYDKNRNAIAENTKAIESNKEAIDQLVKTYKSGDGKLSKALLGLSADVSVLSELMNAQQGVLASVDQAAQSQKKAMSDLSSKLNALDKILSNKVASNEEAIKAIDSFRLQVNRELIRLKGG